MLRVLNARGELHGVSNVVPIIEMVVPFNGKKRRFIEVAKDLHENPNGVLLINKDSNRMDGWNPQIRNLPNEYIGNLSTERVKEVLMCLLKDGYYDFSKLKYQKVFELKDVVLDSGVSGAYTSCMLRDSLLTIREFRELYDVLEGHNIWHNYGEEWKLEDNISNAELNSCWDTDSDDAVWGEDEEVDSDDVVWGEDEEVDSDDAVWGEDEEVDNDDMVWWLDEDENFIE